MKALLVAKPSLLLLLSLAAVLGLVGCYGSTEPATNIKVDGATLNAHGTANNGPAYSYFEYWQSGNPGSKVTTERIDWPAGANGAFTGTAYNLWPATEYSFRVCGGDRGQPAACAQTLTFQTVRPSGDMVHGDGLGSAPNPSPGNQVHVDASSDPSGANPKGTLSALGFSGNVTCLSAHGNRAAVGAVGQYAFDNDPEPEALLWQIVDGGPFGTDMARQDLTQGATPPNCASATFTGLGAVRSSTIFVWDTP
jgi:hypothetical protein